MYNKRQELILDYIKDNPATKREDIEIFFIKMGIDTTKMTITRDLKLLLENGDIEKSGQSKATVYNPSVKIKEALKNLIEVINKTDNPVEKALTAVLMIAYILPFEDVNTIHRKQFIFYRWQFSKHLTIRCTIPDKTQHKW